MKRLVIAAACLTGCATTPQEASVQMRGMSRAAVLTCAGAPQSEAVDGTTQVMSYSRQVFIAPNSYQCTATVVLVSGRVDRVNYSGAPGICSRLLEDCARK